MCILRQLDDKLDPEVGRRQALSFQDRKATPIKLISVKYWRFLLLHTLCNVNFIIFATWFGSIRYPIVGNLDALIAPAIDTDLTIKQINQ